MTTSNTRRKTTKPAGVPDQVTDYKLLRDADCARLVSRVQAEVTKGWQPWNAPVGFANAMSDVYVQAMVRCGDHGTRARNLTMEGVRLLQTKLLDGMKDGNDLAAPELLRIVLAIEAELETTPPQ